MTDQILSLEQARALYVSGDAAHDFDHVLRVTRLAEEIAQAEGADVTVVRLAALLHDVPVSQPDVQDGEASTGRSAHHLAAADHARRLLAPAGLGTSRLDNIVHCIEAHRFRDQTIQPATLEAKCLYDADKLDSMGAFGVARCFAYAGAHDSRLWHEPWRAAPPHQERPQGADYTPVHEFVYKLRRLQETLFTPAGRAMGRSRHEFMETFFERLDQEAAGFC